MRYTFAAAVVLALGAGIHASDAPLTGDYVEARTAEVYTGGCIMGSEGEVSGREAIMAWRVREGSFNGVTLDGLSVVAVVAGDVNLGTHQLGGKAPTTVKALVMVDQRATAAQQEALVGMAKALAPEVVRDVVATTPTPISFEAVKDTVRLSAGEASLDVTTNVEHSPACGASKWFEPLSNVKGATIGLARSFEWSGDGLGARWKQLDRKSAYVGSFSLGR
jgi:hypothetical protein